MTSTRLQAFVFFVALLLTPATAFAAKLRTEVAARRVGVGQSFEVKLTATQEDGDASPTAPQMPIRGKAQVRGPSIGTQRRMMMHNFSFDSESSVVATWVVTPTETGKLVIGPGTFQVGGKTLRGETIVVEVVKEPQGAGRRDPFGRRGSIFGPDPNDIFGDDPFDLLSRRLGRGNPEAPEEYQVETAPSPIAFLRLLVDKKQVVLGEPVRLMVLAYGSRGAFQEVSPNEPSLPDFLSYSVLESSHDEPTFQTEIEGTRFLVKKLREYIVIPLKTGDLEIGHMTAVLQGNRTYPMQGSPLGMRVESPEFTLKVTDTPEAGRPKGYFPGDVGNYRIKADVSPRTLTQGEYAEVILQVEGRGQIPTKLILPESKNITFEPPTMSGGPEIRDGELQGTRVFKYAVQVNEAGTIDLGEVRLPFFNHFKKRYQTARAELGTVTVDARKDAPNAQKNAPTADPNQSADEQEAEASDGIPLAPRKAPLHSSEAHLPVPPTGLWWAIFLTPAFVGFGAGAMSLLRRVQRSEKSKDKSQVRAHLKQAEQELAEGKEREATKSLERALYEALDRATGEKNRGFLREHLTAELTRAGLEKETAERAQALLVLLEQSRYDNEKKLDKSVLSEANTLLSELGKSEKKLSKKRASREVSP